MALSLRRKRWLVSLSFMSVVLLLAELGDLAAFFLVGAVVGGAGVGATQGLALQGGLFPFGNAVSGFLVQGGGQGGVATPGFETGYHDFLFIDSLAQADGGAQGHFPAGFDTVAVVVHLATFDHLLRDGPGLVEACRPDRKSV